MYKDHPSFSSLLLDQIYSSIDEQDHQVSTVYRHDQFSKQSRFSINKRFQNDHDVRRSVNLTSGSSDSSSRGGFSSPEGESVFGVGVAVSSRSKTIRMSTQRYDQHIGNKDRMIMYGKMYEFEDLRSKQQNEGKLMKTKSRALKMYGDLKKMKQPISPGGRLFSFLNSLFTAGNSKNTKRSSFSGESYDNSRSHVNGQSKFGGESTCSSASSYSRSCLSNTSSSRGKLGYNSRRSVNESEHRSLYGDESNPHALKFVKNYSNNEYKAHSSEKTEAPSNVSRNYNKKVEYEFDLIKCENEIDLNDDDDDDDDDAASDTSSDLFELENFSTIGMENYGDELPVFETTHLSVMASPCKY
ncbi:hypothetical protein R6Q59_013024 [Mikania micrantha]